MSDLEQRLVALGHELDVPEPPDVASRVLATIGEAARPPLRRRRVMLALAVLALAALLATLAIPDARSALLRFLQIGGARIELVDDLPEVAGPAELELMLGKRVSLAEARGLAGFDLLEPDEEPDAVFLGERGTVWFLYGTPDAVRLLVSQTPDVRIDEPFVLKKLAAAGTRVEGASVRGSPAYFLSGEPHVVLLLDELGEEIPESLRLARDVLVWEERGRTVRLEGDLTLDEALELADAMR
ncbi:MAG TPA: hypothetical protein VJM06_00770 [Gaiellaceae bacterium]|nr:hypothetical protein [Gaiellaceae bacterium]